MCTCVHICTHAGTHRERKRDGDRERRPGGRAEQRLSIRQLALAKPTPEAFESSLRQTPKLSNFAGYKDVNRDGAFACEGSVHQAETFFATASGTISFAYKAPPGHNP